MVEIFEGVHSFQFLIKCVYAWMCLKCVKDNSFKQPMKLFDPTLLRPNISLIPAHREPGEGDLDVGVHEVPGDAPEGVLQVRHDRGVHPDKRLITALGKLGCSFCLKLS